MQTKGFPIEPAIPPTGSTPHPSLDAQLSADLDALEDASLRRRLQPMSPNGKYVHCDGQRLLNLASNDYLGLSNHPRLVAAAAQAANSLWRRVPVRLGLSAARCRCIPRSKNALQQFKHAEAALLLPTGYMANLAVLSSLAQAGDLICQDKLNHASLLDAAKQSAASVRTYPHQSLAKLERLLASHARAAPGHRRFIVTDGIFSMDGDCADLPTLSGLADRYHAVMVVDEAHGTGILGAGGSGLAEHQGVAEQIYQAGAGGVVVSTASKALGGLGGVVTGSRTVIDTLTNHARPMIYSTAIPPMQAAAIGEAVAVIQDEPARRLHLADLCRHAHERLSAMGWPLPEAYAPTPILPLVVGEAAAALALAEHMRQHGLLGVAIRPPTVAPGAARVRITLRADLEMDELDHALQQIGPPRR